MDHRVLTRQLRKLGLDPEVLPANPEAWRDLIEAVNRTYHTADQDRYTLERSLKLSSDELREANGKLRERFHEMERQLLQMERLDSIGRLAGGVAHDFNNILGVILSYSEMVLADVPAGPIQEDVREVIGAAQRGAELARQLLAFSRREIVRPEVLDLDEAVRSAIRMLGPTLGEVVQLESVSRSTSPTVEIDPTQAQQVLVNLTLNARDAMPGGGVVRYTTADWTSESSGPPPSPPLPHPDLARGEWILLSVADEGVGMSSEVRDRIFEPFFTTKERGRGTGMGLATVYGIVRQAGGHIWVDSEPGRGTRFDIYLPKREGVAARAPIVEMPEAMAEVGHTVLLVEDEPQLLAILSRVLIDRGFRVVQAGNVRLALEAAGNCDQIDLVLSDIVMPDGSGPQVIEGIRSRGHDPKVLYMSGYPQDVIDQHGVLQEGIQLIHKPFTSQILLRTVEEMLAV